MGAVWRWGQVEQELDSQTLDPLGSPCFLHDIRGETERALMRKSRYLSSPAGKMFKCNPLTRRPMLCPSTTWPAPKKLPKCGGPGDIFTVFVSNFHNSHMR
jgi:hypothetical protein